MVRYQGDKVIVAYAGLEYELAAVNDLSTRQMLEFCRGRYKDLWQKRFAKDMVIVLADMGHPVNAEKTVGLTLVESNTGKKKTVERAAMTKENRQAVSKALRSRESGQPSN